MTTRLSKMLMALAVTLAPLPALAQASVERLGYGHGEWDFGWGHMLFGGLMMIAFWGGLILLIVFVVRWLGRGPSHGNGASPPGARGLEILQERYARGEIDKAEYEERKQLLSG